MNWCGTLTLFSRMTAIDWSIYVTQHAISTNELELIGIDDDNGDER